VTLARDSQRSPTTALLFGLVLTLAMVVAYSWYISEQISGLRRLQTDLTDRNRKDSLQLLRIQNDLASLAVAMRDMADRSEPYPLSGWQPMFERLRGDLKAAISLERTLAPAARQPGQQEQLERTSDAYWAGVDRLFERARAGDEEAAIRLIRGTLISQQRALDGMVAQFLVANNRMQQEATEANRAIYDRVAVEILVLVGVLLIGALAWGTVKIIRRVVNSA